MSSSVNCYFDGGSGAVVRPKWYPCSTPNATVPYVTCCLQGDICMSNNMCHFTHASTNTSGYYVAECTDPSLADHTCLKHCLLAYPDALPLSNGLWACCGETNGSPDCTETTSDTFAAPPIDELQVVGTPNSAITAVAPATSVPSSSSSSSPTLHYTLVKSSTAGLPSTIPPAPTPSSSSHLSGGAIAGIVIGAVAGLVFIFVVGAVAIRRRRRDDAMSPLQRAYTGSAPGLGNSDGLPAKTAEGSSLGYYAGLPGDAAPSHPQAPLHAPQPAGAAARAPAPDVADSHHRSAPTTHASRGDHPRPGMQAAVP